MPLETLARIRARGPIGMRLGLDRMAALLAGLGNPQAGLRGALIAGTNGKGSTAALTAAVLQAAGYTTLRSPSPHLLSERERITVDERPIAATELDALLAEVLRASEAGEAGHGPSTEFELFTAAAYLWAARQRIEVVVMEVGLGGRLDATNTWASDVSAVTSVALDHEELLGRTVAAIAAEKAAIIKPGSRAVSGAEGAALAVIAARAASVGSPLDVRRALPVERMDLDGLVLRDPRLGPLHVPLLGRHQALNTAVALGIVDALGEAGVAQVPDVVVPAGLAAARWPGRLERIDCAGTTVLLDGAHNPDGAAALARALDELAAHLPDGPATLLLGVLGDKDADAMLAALLRASVVQGAGAVMTRVPDNERALPAVDLASTWQRRSGRPVAAAIDDVDTALDRALELAADAGGILLVAGSLYLVGHVRARLHPESEEER